MKRPEPRLPIVTLALVAAVLTVYGLELAGDGIGLCRRFGFVPADPTLGTGLTSLFLHDPSGLAHVGGNVVALALFGSFVERSLGHLHFLALYLAGGLAGAGLHLVVDPTSTAPLVGASSALFAVLAVAAVLFGAAMLGFVVVLAASNVAHAFGAPVAEGVAFGAHIGGFTVGVLVMGLARLRGVDPHRPVRRQPWRAACKAQFAVGQARRVAS